MTDIVERLNAMYECEQGDPDFAFAKEAADEIERLRKLWTVCEAFIEKQNISCAETIYQTDRVIENAYDFIAEVCDVVGYKEYQND